MDNWFPLLPDVSDLLGDVPTDSASMDTPAAPSGGAGSEYQYPLPYSLDEYMRLHITKIGARCYVIISNRETFVLRVGPEGRETVFVC